MCPPVTAIVRHRPAVTDEKCQRSANVSPGRRDTKAPLGPNEAVASWALTHMHQVVRERRKPPPRSLGGERGCSTDLGTAGHDYMWTHLHLGARRRLMITGCRPFDSVHGRPTGRAHRRPSPHIEWSGSVRLDVGWCHSISPVLCGRQSIPGERSRSRPGAGVG